MKLIICGLPGTGKTTLCKRIASEFDYTYMSDWQIWVNSGVSNITANRKLVSKNYAYLIRNYLTGSKGDIVVDCDYSISPDDYVRLLGGGDTKIIYLGFCSVEADKLYELFRKSSSNVSKTDSILKKEIKYYISISKDYEKSCREHNLGFVDICKDREVIMNDIIRGYIKQ